MSNVLTEQVLVQKSRPREMDTCILEYHLQPCRAMSESACWEGVRRERTWRGSLMALALMINSREPGAKAPS